MASFLTHVHGSEKKNALKKVDAEKLSSKSVESISKSSRMQISLKCRSKKSRVDNQIK